MLILTKFVVRPLFHIVHTRRSDHGANFARWKLQKKKSAREDSIEIGFEFLQPDIQAFSIYRALDVRESEHAQFVVRK